MDAGPEAAALLWASEMLFSCVSRASWSPAMCSYLAVLLQKPECATSDVWVGGTWVSLTQPGFPSLADPLSFGA